jgi:glycosyltransferase involved in cell wall biosynthesis
VRIAFLTSTPPSPTEGSGTFVALDGMVRGLAALGHDIDIRSLRVRTGFHTFDRWLYNAAVVQRPPDADVVVGVDLDGFLWARHRPTRRPSRRTPPRYVAALKGVIADELRNERGLVRALLTIQARWERRNATLADRVVVTSRYSAGVAADAYAIPPAKLVVIPEPIDLADWRRRFAAAEHRRTSHPTVLSVARMYPRKRLDDLVRAADLLRRRIPDVRVRIVGEGPESARVRALAGSLGLAETVTFLGEVSRGSLAVEYGSADCFCLPSVQEGFGLVFTEAMAAGLPIVACRAAAVPELVEDARTGILVTPRRPDELADALERLLHNRELRKELGAAGMRKVDAFDLEPVARRWAEVLAS